MVAGQDGRLGEACVDADQRRATRYQWRIGRATRLLAEYPFHLFFGTLIHRTGKAVEHMLLTSKAFRSRHGWARVLNRKEIEGYLGSGILLQKAVPVDCAFDIVSDFCLAWKSAQRGRQRLLDMPSRRSCDFHAHNLWLLQAVRGAVVVEWDL